jgi:glycosyltransferase involved in cell wall biosynthesis
MKHTDKTGIAFLGYNYSFWTGGVNYIRNLIIAINATETKDFFPMVFFERDADKLIKRQFSNISKTETFNIYRPDLFVRKFLDKFRKDNSYLRYYFEKNNIRIVSHSVIDFKNLNVKRISWLPDFQHLNFPENFSANEIEVRNATYIERIINSDLTIVSSFCALNDLANFCPGYQNKAAVLHFVVWIDHAQLNRLQPGFGALKNRFGIEGEYFFLPNQFWKHKNHKVVFEAIKILKSRNQDILLVCTGNLESRDQNDIHSQKLLSFLRENNLQRNIRILGLIDEADLMCLMRNSIAVINPSYFEGWSTTVEECISMGKTILLSDIPVHKEQNPGAGHFFNPDDPEEVADLMRRIATGITNDFRSGLEERAKDLLPSRVNEFGNNYLKIINQIE